MVRRRGPSRARRRGIFGAITSGGEFMDTLELGLAGKVAIVTGGSEGLGLACVERFARSGAKVAACARRKDVLERGVDQVRRATGGDILAMTADVTKGAEAEAFVKATLARFGGVDI